MHKIMTETETETEKDNDTYLDLLPTLNLQGHRSFSIPKTPFNRLIVFGITCSSILSCPGGQSVPRTGYYQECLKSVSSAPFPPATSSQKIKQVKFQQILKFNVDVWDSTGLFETMLLFTASDSICIRVCTQFPWSTSRKDRTSQYKSFITTLVGFSWIFLISLSYLTLGVALTCSKF